MKHTRFFRILAGKEDPKWLPFFPVTRSLISGFRRLPEGSCRRGFLCCLLPLLLPVPFVLDAVQATFSLIFLLPFAVIWLVFFFLTCCCCGNLWRRDGVDGRNCCRIPRLEHLFWYPLIGATWLGHLPYAVLIVVFGGLCLVGMLLH